MVVFVDLENIGKEQVCIYQNELLSEQFNHFSVSPRHCTQVVHQNTEIKSRNRNNTAGEEVAEANLLINSPHEYQNAANNGWSTQDFDDVSEDFDADELMDDIQHDAVHRISVAEWSARGRWVSP